MHIFAFLDNYTFSIEPVTNRRYRLIIYKNGEEHVCRKESLYKLKLQLLKHGDEIAVEVKGELIGNISKATLLTSLEA
jgi:hypothetical protein